MYGLTQAIVECQNLLVLDDEGDGGIGFIMAQ